MTNNRLKINILLFRWRNIDYDAVYIEWDNGEKTITEEIKKKVWNKFFARMSKIKSDAKNVTRVSYDLMSGECAERINIELKEKINEEEEDYEQSEDARNK